MAAVVPATAANAAPATVIRIGYGGGAVITVDCTTGTIRVDGAYQEVIHTNADGSWSGHVTIKATASDDEGNAYVLNENASSIVKADGTVLVQDQFHFISKGSAPNFVAFIKFTILANGDAVLITDRTECIGRA
ncbi:hypothetical protein LJR078_003221 [Arthrobacter sp. LjRoot78]|uniref:hypothetical protein n=1 Tax=Arthrobacter sp. LjRoot78 TaxID=3342338 RepID=UPI003ECDCC4D